ncbi:uncharacterized protein MYCFIDRAFT_79614 [Pseudocercospora fijiensis CIRAD86]|uniref:Uncharacterized protein n=1 Tax=Pseudocercospora fijiensis (strain CIRAD86) TaxID=383855 RepID=M2ZJM0_PSEFD|nr:uncharacterized protein MYCFIDRAFT_79614 [Pseudocercospora fijiensis CIRAD86]EME79284.1 hypothetical protein MYCFIDRAFT_79614 [Pseudocercospora fijiensis CIRAD86]
MENALAPRDSEYDETTILSLVTALYKALIQIGGIEESDVLWAPAEGHALDFSSLQDDARIDMRVVSLMQKLPIMRMHEQNQILPLMYAVDYRDPDHLAMSRDIDKAEYYQPPYRLNMANARPSVMVLFRARGRDDCTLLLDVADITQPFRRLHHLLVEDYGWPNAFKRDEWKRDVPNLVDEAQEAEMAHGLRVAAELRRRAAEGNGSVVITKEDAWMDL